MSGLKNINVIAIIIVLIFTTKFFQSTPFEKLFFQIQAGFLGIVLLFIIFYLLDLSIKRQPVNKVVLYFLILILFMPIYSAYRSSIEFGQPYFYGLASQRSWLLLGVGIWFYYILTSNRMSLKTIEKAFIFMAWGSLIIFSFFVLTFDPSQLTGDENFVHMTKGRGLRFKFQTFFVTFGALYYFIKYSKYRNVLDLFFLLLFLSYIVFIVQGRTYMIFLAATFFLYYYFNYEFSKFILIIIKVILFLAGIIIVTQIFLPEYIERMGDLFVQMFTVLAGEESNDMSSNARIWTSKIVFDYFDTHSLSIWFGTGRVSNQWNDGYERLFGYFYPSDIGILGGTFLYGIFGILLLLVLPTILGIKEIRMAKDTENIFITTIKYILILSILKSLQDGLYFGVDIWIVLFFILFSYNILNRKNNANT